MGGFNRRTTMERQSPELLGVVKQLIKESRRNAALAVNTEITLLHYRVGKKINQEILQNNSAKYGKRILRELSVKLVADYGQGWSVKHLLQPEDDIVNDLNQVLRAKWRSCIKRSRLRGIKWGSAICPKNENRSAR